MFYTYIYIYNISLFLISDLRLYREFSPKKQNKKDWECVCVTLSDWCSFIKQFRKTSNVQEKELYSYLNCELFPFVEFQLSVGLLNYYMFIIIIGLSGKIQALFHEILYQ